LTVPGYLQPDQADQLAVLGSKSRIPVVGSLPITLAAALAGHAQQLWSRSVVVVDVDDHALTVALVLAGQDRAHLVETRVLPALGLHAWRDRLINALSDLCVWQTRRDPRDAPQAEQGLYDQLDALLEACSRHQPTQIAVQATQWYHHLLVQPGQTLAFCSPLASQAVRAVEALGNLPPGDEAPPTVLLTQAAARLPGVRSLLGAMVQSWIEVADGIPRPRAASDDFGDNLLVDAGNAAFDATPVAVLSPEAPARAAHGLAEVLRSGDPVRWHLTSVAPLPLAEPVEAGPARLHFAGRDYLLHEEPFTLGAHAGCQLHLDPGEHPAVADRHCDIVFDHRCYLVLNRSRQGTLVNDMPVSGSVALHAGDRIKLGSQGPVVRFLGRPVSAPVYHTTA
jgi:hypothetical protein